MDNVDVRFRVIFCRLKRNNVIICNKFFVNVMFYVVDKKEMIL